MITEILTPHFWTIYLYVLFLHLICYEDQILVEWDCEFLTDFTGFSSWFLLGVQEGLATSEERERS